VTNTQRWILEAVDEHWTLNGFAPSIDDIRKAVGLRSKSGTHKAIHKLLAAGCLSRVPGIVRSWKVKAWPDAQGRCR
jgi:SOS-response transcriptional repressor LexA